MENRDRAAQERVLADIDALGLNQQLCELTTLGYTVLPGVLSADLIARATAAILRRVERRTGKSIDPAAASADDFQGMEYESYLVFEDPVFQEILLQPRPLALISYLLGESCLLSSMGSHFRGPGGLPLPLHADTAPVGMSAAAMVANCNYALTPYSREAGALVMVPGSHLKQRHPTPEESFTVDGQTFAEVVTQGHSPEALASLEWSAPPGAVTMDIEPGDAVVFHGNTWHGGWRRDIPGTRINLAAYFCRSHIATQERRGETRYPEVFERYAETPRFAELLGEQLVTGWREEGPDYSKMATSPTGLFD